METEMTIATVTKCPTCGSKVKVAGKTTHYYVPVCEHKLDWKKIWKQVNRYTGTFPDEQSIQRIVNKQLKGLK